MFTTSKIYKEGFISFNDNFFGFENDYTVNKNFLSYGYKFQEKLVNYKYNSKFCWKINETERTDDSLLNHSIKKAEHFVNTCHNIKLLISGGIDSEHMAFSFLDFKNDVELIFFDYGSNKEDKLDLLNSKIFKEFRTNIVTIDAREFFLSNSHLYYGLKYRTSFPEVMLFLKALDTVSINNDYFIISGDIPEPVIKNNKLNFSFPSDNICAIDRWSLLNYKKICSNFLLYDPKSLFLTTQELCKKKYQNFEYKNKKDFYNNLGYNLELKKQKYTGLENLRKELTIWNFSAIIEDFKAGMITDRVVSFLNNYHNKLENNCM